MRFWAQSLHGTLPLSDQFLVISQAPASVSLPRPMVECLADNHCGGFDMPDYLSHLSGTMSCLHFSEHPEQCPAYSWSSGWALDVLEPRAVTGGVSETFSWAQTPAASFTASSSRTEPQSLHLEHGENSICLQVCGTKWRLYGEMLFKGSGHQILN